MAIRTGNFGLSRITPVQAALSDTSNILGQGLRETGQAPLRASESALNRAKHEFELGNFERYQKPQLEAQRAYNMAPTTYGEYDKDEPSAIWFAQYLAEPIAKMKNGRWDTSTGVRHLIIKDPQTGQERPETNYERQLSMNNEKNLVYSKAKIATILKDQLARYQGKAYELEQMGATEAPEDSPIFAEYQRLQTNIKNAETALDPKNLIPQLEIQKRVLRSFGGDYSEDIKRIDGEIAAYKKQAEEIAKEERAQAGKIALEKTKAKLKTGDYRPTALMQNIPFVAKKTGMTEKEATEFLISSKGKSDDQVQIDLVEKYASQGFEGDELKKVVRNAMDVLIELRGEKQEETGTNDPLGIR